MPMERRTYTYSKDEILALIAKDAKERYGVDVDPIAIHPATSENSGLLSASFTVNASEIKKIEDNCGTGHGC